MPKKSDKPWFPTTPRLPRRTTTELWFLVWRRPNRRPFVTAICGYSRRSVAEGFLKVVGGKWKRHYRRGARIERIAVPV